MNTKDSVSKELEKVLRKSEQESAEKDRLLCDKTFAYDAMKMESDATIQALRDQNMQTSAMNERLYTARSVLEKEKKDLTLSLSKKVQELSRVEKQLREKVVHEGRPRVDHEVTGLLKAFDLFTEVPMASKETQTDSTQDLLYAAPGGTANTIEMRDGGGVPNKRKKQRLYESILPQHEREAASELMPAVVATEPDSPFLLAQSDDSSCYNEQIGKVEMNENILIGSRSQASSFLVQGDRIHSLEQENMNLTA